MKTLIVITLILASLVPTLPASAAPYCSGDPDKPNNQSSLSSTSEGGQTCSRLVSVDAS
jgi:hypothetical protein